MEVDEAFIHFATDYAFRVPALKIAQAQSQYGDVYVYRFEYISEFARKTGMMCDHGMDLPCDFNQGDFPFAKVIFQEDPQDVVERLIQEVHMSWVRFVKEGSPNEGQWPKFEDYRSPIRVFDKASHTRQQDCTQLMQLWGDMRFYE